MIEETGNATDPVAFTGLTRRLAVIGAAWGLILTGFAYLVGILLESLPAGRLSAPSLAFFVVLAVLLLPLYTVWFVLPGRRRPPYVRVGPAGIELAGARRNSVFVPWSAIDSTRFRGSGLLAELHVAVKDPAAIMVGQRGGRRPCQHHRDGRHCVGADVWALPKGGSCYVPSWPATARPPAIRRNHAASKLDSTRRPRLPHCQGRSRLPRRPLALLTWPYGCRLPDAPPSTPLVTGRSGTDLARG